jgi:ketosteroid isomerase-like protein
VFLFLAALLSIATPALADQPNPKDIVSAYTDRVMNGRDLAALDELVAEDVESVGELPGRDALRQRLADGYEARDSLFSEWSIETRQLIAEDNAVAAYYELVAKTPDGKEVSVPLAAFYEVSDGKITRIAGVTDTSSLAEQLGG